MADNNISLEGMSAQDINNLAAVSVALANDPQTRRDFQRLLKKRNPQYTAPDLEVDEAVERLNGSLDEKLKGFEEKFNGVQAGLEKHQAQLQEREARERWDAIKMAPIEAGLISKEDLPAVEALMKAEGFAATQYMQAAKYYNAQKASAPPTPSQLTSFKLPDRDALRANPKKAFRENMLQALNESQTRKVTGMFGKVV